MARGAARRDRRAAPDRLRQPAARDRGCNRDGGGASATLPGLVHASRLRARRCRGGAALRARPRHARSDSPARTAPADACDHPARGRQLRGRDAVPGSHSLPAGRRDETDGLSGSAADRERSEFRLTESGLARLGRPPRAGGTRPFGCRVGPTMSHGTRSPTPSGRRSSAWARLGERIVCRVRR